MEGRNSDTPLGRLPSLRAPRDLTLGGNGRGLRGDLQRRGVKRTFTPNIPAPKIKKEQVESPVEVEVAHSSETPRGKRTSDHGGRGQGNRGQGNRGRGQGRGQNIVYQKSIFEEWSNEKPKPKEDFYGGGVGGGGGGFNRRSFGSRGLSSEVSSVIKVKEEAMDDGNTDDIMRDLLCDNFLDDKSLATIDPAMFPVLIELESKTESKSEPMDVKPLVDASRLNDIKVSEENKDVIDAPEVRTLKPKISVPWTKSLQPPETSFFTPVNEDKKLLLIHFPDVLPGFPSSAPTTSAAKSNAQTTMSDAESSSHSLNDFAEGFIGKMKVRRSGKIELELSNVVFEGSPLPSKFLQEVVVCEFERNALQRPVSGDMIHIGHIGHKINFTPKIDAIVDSIS